MAETTVNTKVLLKNIRLSYANLWHPTSIEEGKDLKYNCVVMIPKDNADSVKQITDVLDALTAEVKAANKGKLPAKFHMPLGDGDTDKPDRAEFAGMYFLNAKSGTKPGIVSKERDEAGKPKPITDESQVYSGCYGHISLNLFKFAKGVNQGIGVSLNNFMKTQDGPKFAGASSAAEDFADIADEEGDDYL